jgi:hypothetical protein
MGASLYEPINVYKPLAADIGIVDGPFEYLTVGGISLPLPFTTRPLARERRRAAGFIVPCKPTLSEKAPGGPQWIHEIVVPHPQRALFVSDELRL